MMMHHPIIEDPLDWDKPKQSEKSHALTWWMIGLAMGILLLAANLANDAGFWPETVAIGAHLSYDTYGLIIFAIFSAGAIVLTRLLRNPEPEMPSWQISVYALGSGLLAAVIFSFIKVVGHWLEPSRMDLVKEFTLALVVGTYCAAAAWGWAAATRDRHWWVGVLVLTVWIVISVLVVQYLNLSW